MTEELQLAWAAGFFDGEGCVAVCKQAHSQSKRPQYQLQISICQKDNTPLVHFVVLFGGTLYSYKSKGVEYWRWCMSNNHAVRCLELIAPFLILKGERARIGIEFQKNLVVWNRDYGRIGYPEHVNAAREEFYQRMKLLNQRGVSSDNPNPKSPGPRKGKGRSGFAGWQKRKSEQKEIQTVN